MHSRYRTFSLATLGLALLLAIGSSPLSAHAQQDDITVTVPEAEPAVGNTVTLNIEADLGENVVEGYSGMQFTFSSSAINVVDVRVGSDFQSSIFNSNVEGDTVTATLAASNTATGSNVEFLQVDVELIQNGGTPFDLTPSDTEESTSVFNDTDGNNLEVTTINQGRVGVLGSAQFIHNAADPAADTVDVYLDGALAVDDFSFRSATPFVGRLTTGAGIDVGVAPSGSSGPGDIIASQTVTLSPGEAHTVVANGVLTPDDFEDNPDGQSTGLEFFAESGADSTAADGEVDLRAGHGATDAPTVDIGEADGPTLFSDLTYGDLKTNYLSAAAEQKTLTVTPSGSDEPLAFFDADLSGLAGSAATVLASGFLNPSANQGGPSFALIAALPNGEVLTIEPLKAEVQLIHNAADPAADTVDIYLDDERVVDDFSFRSATPFVEVDATGEVDLGVAPANSSSVEDTLASQTVTFDPGEAYTVVANGVLTPDDFADNPDGESTGFEFFVEPGAESTASDGEVDVRAVHGATDAPTVDLDANGSTLLDNLTYGAVTTDYLSLPAEDTRLVVTPGDTSTVVASFAAPLSTVDGSAATVLASGFLSPADNQDGPAFRLIAALPNGDVVVLSPADVIPIQQARQKGPDSTVTIEGTVTRAFGSYARLQDNSGPTGASAIVIRQTEGPNSSDFQQDIAVDNIQPGTQLRAQGTLSEFNGLIQINNDALTSYEVQGQASAPDPQEITLSDLESNGEAYESELVQITGLSFNDPDATGGAFENSTSYDVSDGSTEGGSFTFRVQTEAETNLGGKSIPTGTFTFDDVVGEFNGTYQLIGIRSETALPVEMAGFDAVQNGSSVELTWETTSETNNAGFNVQLETEGGWTTLGFKSSKASGGTTTETTSYRYTVDQELDPGTHRFRLKQKDLDGSTSLSDVATVEVGLDEAVSLSAPAPNPTMGTATLEFGVKTSTEVTVSVYNVLGQRVKTLYKGTPQADQVQDVTVDAGSLPSGVYFVRLQADGQTRSQRLTVVR